MTRDTVSTATSAPAITPRARRSRARARSLSSRSTWPARRADRPACMPRYEGSPQYTHAGSGRLGVLLVNSGTPDSLTTRDVRSFLKGLLGDRRTIELSRWLWLPILYGIILPLRPSRSAKKYAK